MPAVFINYRNDSTGWSVTLDTVLGRLFGDDQVFRASRAIPPAEDFGEHILRAVRSAFVLVALVGPRWLARDERDRRRIDDPEDWVRKEIAEALAVGVPVLPILVDDAPRLAAPDLPKDLADLAGKQYLRLHHRSAPDDLDRITREIVRIVTRRTSPAPAGRGDHGWDGGVGERGGLERTVEPAAGPRGRKPAVRRELGLDDHWARSARGTTMGDEMYFTGRAAALARLAGFVAAADAGLCVVTGMPGAGKSALLGALVVRASRPDLLSHRLLDAVPLCRIDAAAHARGKSAAELVDEIGAALGLPAATPDRARKALFEWLRTAPVPASVFVDAVDEADGVAAAADLLREMSVHAGVVVGTRPDGPRRPDGTVPLPGPLEAVGALVVDLDDNTYFSPRDVAEYVASRLRADQRHPDGYGRRERWSDRVLVEAIGLEVAEKIADHSFLVSQLAAEELLHSPVVTAVEPGWTQRRHWPRRFEDWMERDLRRRLGDGADRARQLFVPLAFAERGG